MALKIALLLVMGLLAVIMSVDKNWQKNNCILALVVYKIVVAAFIFIGFREVFPLVVGDDAACASGECQWRLLLLVAHAGALGGLLHMTSSIGHRVGTGEFDRRRALFFLCRPPMGAGLAIVVYFVIQTGLLSPSASGEAAAGTDSAGVYRILALSGLTGLFARRALDKLSETFNIMFQSRRIPQPVRKETTSPPTNNP